MYREGRGWRAPLLCGPYLQWATQNHKNPYQKNKKKNLKKKKKKEKQKKKHFKRGIDVMQTKSLIIFQLIV
jgi:hypothetical protein